MLWQDKLAYANPKKLEKDNLKNIVKKIQEEFNKLLLMLDEVDDVQNVYHNVEI